MLIATLACSIVLQTQTYTISNGVITTDFLESGEGLRLESITDLGAASTITFEAEGDPFQILYKDLATKTNAAIVSPVSVGLVAQNSQLVSVTQQAVLGSSTPNKLTAVWDVDTQVDVGGSTEALTADVTIAWTIPPSARYLSIDTRVTSPSTSTYYVSELRGPLVGYNGIDYNDPSVTNGIDYWAVAFLSAPGCVMENPLERIWPEDSLEDFAPPPKGERIGDSGALSGPLNGDATPLSTNVTGFYGSETDRLFYVDASDSLGEWHEWMFEPVFGAGGALESLNVGVVYRPENVFSTGMQKVRDGAVRMGIEFGDWTKVADMRRARIIEDKAALGTDWYEGTLIGSGPDKNAPIDLERTSFKVQFSYPIETGKQDDEEPEIAEFNDLRDYQDIHMRNTLHAQRLAGPGVAVRWYDWYYPDVFNEFFFLGMLPGVPSAKAAIGLAANLNGALVAPYVQTSVAFDLTENKAVSENAYPQGLKDPVLEANWVGLQEDAARVEFGEGTSTLLKFTADFNDGSDLQNRMCPAGDVWAPSVVAGQNQGDGLWVEKYVEALAEFGADAAYLDYFFTYPCYYDGHAQHAPGAGTYAFNNALRRVELLRDDLIVENGGDEDRIAIIQETPFGRFGKGVDMLTSKGSSVGLVPLVLVPDTRALSFVPSFDLDGNGDLIIPPGSDYEGYADIVANTYAVPLVRAVHDDLKMGGIGQRNGARDRRLWIRAAESIIFGAVASDVFDLSGGPSEFFDDNRFNMGDKMLLTFMCRHLFQKKYFEYQNGTIRRMPELVDVTYSQEIGVNPGGGRVWSQEAASPNASKIAVGAPGFGSGSIPLGRAYKSLQTDSIPMQMYRHANGNLALMAINPWVGNYQGVATIDVRIDPARYPEEFAGKTSYKVFKVKGFEPLDTTGSGIFSSNAQPLEAFDTTDPMFPASDKLTLQPTDVGMYVIVFE